MPQKVLSFSVEPSAQRSVEALLPPEYELTSVETSQQALRHIAARRPDAIVVAAFRSVDPLLPFFSALSMEPPLPLLLVAPAPFGAVSLLIQKVVCRCLRVPFTPSRLRAEMEEMLRSDSASLSAEPGVPSFLLMEQLASEVAGEIALSLAPLKNLLTQSQAPGDKNLFLQRDLLPLLRRGIEPLERLARSLSAVRTPPSFRPGPIEIRPLIERALKEVAHDLFPDQGLIDFEWEKNPLPAWGDPEDLHQTVGLILRSLSVKGVSRLLIRTDLRRSSPSGPRMRIEVSAFSSYLKEEPIGIDLLLAQKRLWDQGISLALSAGNGKRSAILDLPLAPGPFQNRIQARRVSARPISFAERRKAERRADLSSLPDPFRV